MDCYVDVVGLLVQLIIFIFMVIILQMFIYWLLQQVCLDFMCIVFFEGDDDCIFKLVGCLFQCGIVDLIILGDEVKVCLWVVEFGVDLDGVMVIELCVSELYD